MNGNKTASTLKVIGIIAAICGFFVGLYFYAHGNYFIPIALTSIIVGGIICLLFMGFAEVISLLQRSVNQQEYILTYLDSIQKSLDEE